MAPMKSKFWKLFTKTEDNNFVKCILCAKALKYSNNTTNMIQHIKLKCKKDDDEFASKTSNNTVTKPTEDSNKEMPCSSRSLNENTQPLIADAFSTIQSFSLSGTRQQKLTQSIVEMVVTDTLPIKSETSKESLENGFDLWAFHKSLIQSKKRKQNNDTFPQDELSIYLNCQVLDRKRNPAEVREEMKTDYFLKMDYTLTTKKLCNRT